LIVAVATVLSLAYAIHFLVERRYNARFRRWLEPRLGALDRIAGGLAVRSGRPVRPPQEP